MRRRVLTAALPALLLATSIVSAQTWVFQGPHPIQDGQGESLPPSVSGAVHTVLAHPSDANVLWIGAVNGGVWKTTNATAAAPTWTPLTDGMPSLSIGALAFDRSAANFPDTLYAGIGTYSSFGQAGRLRGGLLRTTDGGATWTSLGGFADQTISGLAVRGSTILASVSDSDPFSCDSVGVYRSVDGGASFVRLSGGGFLPKGVVYDLVEDPTDAGRFYAGVALSAICGGVDLDGIYRSGATFWTKVSSVAMDALIGNVTSNIELAVGNAGQVYAAVMNDGVLSGLFRAGVGGTSWVALDLPRTNEQGTLIGLHPSPKGPGPDASPGEIAGGQGAIHFSIVADPSNASVVYVGGDRQPVVGDWPNSLGATNYTGRLFRVNAALPSGSQASSLTHCSTTIPASCAAVSTTSNTAPHADSREMAFDAAGNLIEVDDGGVYRRTNPSGIGDWYSMMGSLGVTELHDVAYDTRSDILIGGTQDNGTAQQIQTANPVWTGVQGGDGGDVAIDVTSEAGLARSVRYRSSQYLLQFRRATYDATNAPVSTTSPALIPLAGSPAIQGSFVTPVELNAIDPLRLLIGAFNGVYESLDAGSTVTGLAPAFVTNSEGDALAYGGRRFGVDNAEVIYAFDDVKVYTRSAAGSPLVHVATLPAPAGYVTDIALDPDDWHTAYVTDYRGAVFASTDAGVTWTNITGNLGTFTSSLPLLAIEFVPSPAGDAVYIGGAYGVFRMATASPGTWSEYGTGLSEADVWDLDYDPQDDVLAAATLGRGAWIVANVAGVVCGDGLVEAPELCDAGGESASCDTDCTLVACGDGWVNETAGETCDDGNRTNGDGCDDHVAQGGSCGAPFCGDGVVDSAEECDDGNSIGGDGCSAACIDELCGDGVVNDTQYVNVIQEGDFRFPVLVGWDVHAAGSGSFYSATPGAPTPQTGLPTAPNPLGGSYYAVSDSSGAAPGTHALMQPFQVPPGATSVELGFQMFVNDWSGLGPIVDAVGLDHTGAPNQHARVDLLVPSVNDFEAGAAVVANLYLGVDVGPTPRPYVPYTFDLTGIALPGEIYRLRFAEVHNLNNLSLGVDNVRLIATVPMEACDDGNTVPGDGCSDTCQPEGCSVDSDCDDASFCNGVESCDPTVGECLSGAAPPAIFPEAIVAPNAVSFGWTVPADVTWVRGDLATLASYGILASSTATSVTLISSGGKPAADRGFYYLVKYSCPHASWSSGGAGECATPGACPPGGRDGSLP
jgi:cysteine-rich repeat protein